MRSVMISISLVVLAAAILIGGRIWLGRKEGQTVRDIERIADVRRIQFGFEMLHLREQSYMSATTDTTCHTGMDVRTCALSRYVNELPTIADPSGGGYFLADDVTDSTFAVRFRLETGIGEVAPGWHLLDQEGLH